MSLAPKTKPTTCKTSVLIFYAGWTAATFHFKWFIFISSTQQCQLRHVSILLHWPLLIGKTDTSSISCVQCNNLSLNTWWTIAQFILVEQIIIFSSYYSFTATRYKISHALLATLLLIHFTEWNMNDFPHSLLDLINNMNNTLLSRLPVAIWSEAV